MELYNPIIREVEALAGASTPKRYAYDPAEAWEDTGAFELVMLRDAAYELGGSGKSAVNFTCVTSSAELVPGDEIVGFVTRGRGVTIHRTDCINVLNLPEMERNRLIDAEWQAEEDEKGTATYATEISIYANNRIGMYVDIARIFTEREIDVTNMNARTNKQGKATITMSFDIHGTEELNTLMAKIRQIDGVLDIERTTG